MKRSTLSATFIIQNAVLASNLAKKMEHQLDFHGISFTEFMIMHHLKGAPLNTMRRIELAQHVGLSASGITRLIAPMEKTHLVEKESNPRDARQSLVKLSKTGQKLYAEAAVSFEHCSSGLLESLNEKQLQDLVDLSRRVLL